MPYYIKLNQNDIVTSVLDSATAPTEQGTFVETPTFMLDHFGDKYLGDKVAYEDKWEIMEKPVIPMPPPIEPLAQVLNEFQALQTEVDVLKKELAQAKATQEMSQSALGELLLIQAQQVQAKEGV